MSKGAEKHQGRISELNEFGKDLARRSKSHCELCDNHGVKLFIHEVPPVEKQPKFEHCIFICESCQSQIDKPKTMDVNYWHCLHTSIWSEVPAVQIMAVLIAKTLAQKADYAAELLDQVYLSEEQQEWLADAEADLAKKK